MEDSAQIEVSIGLPLQRNFRGVVARGISEASGTLAYTGWLGNCAHNQCTVQWDGMGGVIFHGSAPKWKVEHHFPCYNCCLWPHIWIFPVFFGETEGWICWPHETVEVGRFSSAVTQGIPGILEGTRLDYLGYPEVILDCQFMIMNDRSVKLVLFQHFFKCRYPSNAFS